MPEHEPTLAELADRGEIQALEDRWLPAVEDAGPDRADLLEVVSAVARKGMADRAAALAWSWLASVRERAAPADALPLARDLLLACGDSDDLRSDLLDLYRTVHADRPELDRLIDASGLMAGKSPRRALRTLDLCLDLKVGDFVVDRSTDRAGRLAAIDPRAGTYTVRVGPRDETLDPDALAVNYEVVADNDFRVLTQLLPERLAALAESDPVALVVGILSGRQGQIDSDHLEQLLCPRAIAADAWAAWWSRARTLLRRCPQVAVEGRNPVVLTYHARGQTLEEEIAPAWTRADTPAQRLAVVETYFREARARHLPPAPDMIHRFYKTLHGRVKTSRRGSPGDALAEALVIDVLAAGAPLPPDADAPARRILAEAADLPALLARLTDNRLYLQALDLVRQIQPDTWPDTYLALLPGAPTDACDTIARAIREAGRLDDLRRAVADILADLPRCLDAVCWLWRGPSVAELEPVPRRELLPRLLEHLTTITRSDQTPPADLRHARTRLRAALAADDYAHYRRLITEMDPGMASTIHRTVDRLQGLGHVVHGNLLRIVRDTYPQLFVRARTDPWLDDNVIFCTAQGMQKHEAALNHLLNVKIPENAKAIGEAASRGDLSENSEFKFALEERDLLQARTIRMQQELALARLITANDVSTDEVTVGTKVTLTPDDGGQPMTLAILGPWEADMDRRIYNYRAPLCLRLKGLKVGDPVTLDIDDTPRPFHVTAIANALE